MISINIFTVTFIIHIIIATHAKDLSHKQKSIVLLTLCSHATKEVRVESQEWALIDLINDVLPAVYPCSIGVAMLH